MLKPQRKGAHAAEIHDDALFTLVSKLLFIRLKLAFRGLRHSPAAQLRAILTTAGISLTCLIMYTLFVLPSTPQQRHPAVSSVTHTPVPGPSSAQGGDAGGGAPVSGSYASDLRRRAAELHSEISRFNERESAIVKQRNLWQTAKLLNSELAELKERQNHLGVPASPAADRAADRAKAARTGGSSTRCAESRHPDYRIAMALPWMTQGGKNAQLPPWLPFFVATASHSALLVDWFIFHEGAFSASNLPRGLHASNVRFVDLKTGGMASLFGRTMSTALKLPAANTSAIVSRMRYMFQKWPRLVAEYKPAYGSIFNEWFGNYTHWGYSDMDVVLGQVARFIERSELQDHQIVTYSFGDTEAVYLRGQWTMHQNIAKVNEIWMRCKHLSDGLQHELFQKVAWTRRMEAMGKQSYHKRFLSAEGCYSHRAAHTPGVSIKVANKQFVGLTVGRVATDDVYVIGGALWVCRREALEPSLAALRLASEPMCDLQLQGMQRPLGEATRFEVTHEGCGNWMPQEFRMCAEHLKGSQKHNLLLSEGMFFAQEYEEVGAIFADHGRCKQGAFFHMQEWKKRWDESGSNIDATAKYDTFKLSQDGIHALTGL
mmetsp:Transcript_57675/g.132409  ORF Transcript_57675/g.132409 Transcript_57675/m.132409 type:complete len:601 (-) Transcript_57675:395-2197(-)|eukprot:CAMPEP_0119376860 /NCGR_PEP_ID=MMETSP1334-20130426/41724_1 /TAXON_ID=127549 /ORGANISM="Calcidiscus leptoporus, Strain RCC1130" /LENGTH=600 /DNA_ID=CAMNT_0007395561 /DNA_START=89 /DNA_END=1891 /DNA_ORIENTATION=+